MNYGTVHGIANSAIVSPPPSSSSPAFTSALSSAALSSAALSSTSVTGLSATASNALVTTLSDHEEGKLQLALLSPAKALNQYGSIDMTRFYDLRGGYAAPKPAWQSSAATGLASAAVTGVMHPVGSAVGRAMAEGLRPPHIADLTFRGLSANMVRACMKWSALDSVNRALLTQLIQINEKSPLKLNRKALTGLSASAAALIVAVLLCPVERVRQYQIMQGGSLVLAASSLMRQGSSQLFAGALTAGINTLPNLLIRAFAEQVGQGDAAKTKQVANRMSMAAAPLRTYLTAVKHLQQTHGVAAGKAYVETFQSALKDPSRLLVHLFIGIVLARVGSEIYYAFESLIARGLSTMNSD